MRPRQLVQAWVEAFNRAEVDTLASFYSKDAVNHQVAESPVQGRENIRQMFASGFASAKMHALSRTCSRKGNGPFLSGETPAVSGVAGSSMWWTIKLRFNVVIGTSSRSCACRGFPCPSSPEVPVVTRR